MSVCISAHGPAIRSSRTVIYVHSINWQYLFIDLFIQTLFYLINIY